jgi:hypothetical protein
MSDTMSLKKIGLLFSLVFGLLLLSSCGKDTTKSTHTDPAANEKKAPSFLFVIQAKQGKIETKNGKTYLVLKHADVNHVIMFSDRPNRIVKTITGNDLQKLWKVGNDSFEKDPPNAVLSSAGQKAQIVILNGIEVSKDNVVFPISVRKEAVSAVGGLPDGPLSGMILVVDHWVWCGRVLVQSQLAHETHGCR